MTRKTAVRAVAVGLIVCGVVAGVAVAQRFGGGGRRGGGGWSRYDRTVEQGLREITDRNGTPEWPVDPDFKSDVFTFVRVRYASTSTRSDTGGNWSTDTPDSDLNFSFRLQQMTSLKVDPRPKHLALTDDELFDYPFVYLIEPGRLEFTDAEVVALRRYLLNGGFMMVDDFWGDDEWANYYEQMKRVFPDREPEELDLKHPIFHGVFDLKEKPQMPAIGAARGHDPTMTTDRPWDPGSRDVHYRAFLDDKQRVMVIACHNTDLGDGWEREGEDEWYFREFSEKKAYPMGINIIFYAMTH
jgi:hypothetical protein